MQMECSSPSNGGRLYGRGRPHWLFSVSWSSKKTNANRQELSSQFLTLARCLLIRLLDRECDGLATREGLFAEHEDLQEKESAVDKAVASEDVDAIAIAIKDFCAENEAHLKKEEDIMMPQVMGMKKRGLPLKKFMIEELLAAIPRDDMEFFVSFANQVLDRHSNGMPRARVFDHALWAVSTPEQWETYDLWIQKSVGEEAYKELQAIITA